MQKVQVALIINARCIIKHYVQALQQQQPGGGYIFLTFGRRQSKQMAGL